MVTLELWLELVLSLPSIVAVEEPFLDFDSEWGGLVLILSSLPSLLAVEVLALAKSLAKEDGIVGETDRNRNQKISLLKRIIDHYNIKSSEKKYYSNLIKSYGLRIEAMTSTEIAVKKDLHPRVEQKNPQNVFVLSIILRLFHII